jgi:hypothetical protein
MAQSAVSKEEKKMGLATSAPAIEPAIEYVPLGPDFFGETLRRSRAA